MPSRMAEWRRRDTKRQTSPACWLCYPSLAVAPNRRFKFGGSFLQMARFGGAQLRFDALWTVRLSGERPSNKHQPPGEEGSGKKPLTSNLKTGGSLSSPARWQRTNLATNSRCYSYAAACLDQLVSQNRLLMIQSGREGMGKQVSVAQGESNQKD